ncbi:MAG: 16S rRNA (cytidine(1402)-2'-O)-methyltransferase [Rhodobacteraceae bacterium GWE1_64_9]|nr:MAG: 16S rRNA (cytidine(1402)-2'-O)-methyltransferase [Rhodobacteraceae bacterium GWE1_64_9]OHC49231.1 MAG: 16S rRNA (cytidine(1402)-2'-O)-methyltransferase [Rhodobacteraceae bacterium GWF1_65_7]
MPQRRRSKLASGKEAEMSETGPVRAKLPPGLHFIATPIGAARDITLRALDILAAADVLAAEDTRTLRHLMEIHGVPLNGRPMVAYHDHNGDQARPRLLAALAEGKSVVYASEAGTPLVADPGYQLGRAVIEAGYTVLAAPGPSAVLAALTVSGLPSDRFLFAGFPPSSGGPRQTFLRGIAQSDATVILYESPKRIQKLLDDLWQITETTRRIVVCRELTKRFEEVTRGTLEEVRAAYDGRDVKGEIVVLIDRAPDRAVTPEDLDSALREALRAHRLKDAAALVSEAFGLPKREVYQRALQLAAEQ